MRVTICGRFCPDESVITAGYGNRIRAKYTAKWGVQIVGFPLKRSFTLKMTVEESLATASTLRLRRGGAWKPLTRETEEHKDRRT